MKRDIKHTVGENDALYHRYGVEGSAHIGETEQLCEVIRTLEADHLTAIREAEEKALDAERALEYCNGEMKRTLAMLAKAREEGAREAAADVITEIVNKLEALTPADFQYPNNGWTETGLDFMRREIINRIRFHARASVKPTVCTCTEGYHHKPSCPCYVEPPKVCTCGSHGFLVHLAGCPLYVAPGKPPLGHVLPSECYDSTHLARIINETRDHVRALEEKK
jgi:hypothetical protein